MMKKSLLAFLCFAFLLSLAFLAAAEGIDPALIEAAQKDGELIVYGSCELAYLEAACRRFEELYQVKVFYTRLSAGEVQARIGSDQGNPSADVWFGGSNQAYDTAAEQGLLRAYEAQNAVHLVNPKYKHPENMWYGIYQSILGFMVNKKELALQELDAPRTWNDLLDPRYKGLIWMPDYNRSGTAKLVITTLVQMRGEEKALKYLVKLDRNIGQYTASSTTPSKNVGTGECVIGIGFLQDAVYQFLQGYDNIDLIIPAEGSSYEIGATAIFQGCRHEAAARLWIEYALSPDCVELAEEADCYQFPVIDDAQPPAFLASFPNLDPGNTMDFDFKDSRENTSKYVQDYFDALANGSFENCTYTVQYDQNTSDAVENMPAAQTEETDFDLLLSSLVPSRRGFVFQGWGVSADGPAVYQPGDRFSSDQEEVITLFAVWEEDMRVIVLPDSTTTIEQEAFANADFTSVVIPANVCEIGPRAFADNTNLTKVTCYSIMMRVAEDAFEGCPNLVIHGYADSPIAGYAEAKGIPFIEND